MTSSIDRYRGGQNLPDRQMRRDLARVEHETLLRMAQVQGDGLVQGDKIREVDKLARDAMTGQAMLRKRADVLSAGDPFIADEMRFFADVARMGKGEIIADTITMFSRRGR